MSAIKSLSFVICLTKRGEVNKINESNPQIQFVKQHTVVTKSAYSVRELSNKFNIKSKIKQDHQHVICYVKCPEETCREDYTGETGRRLSERVISHSGRDKNSHILKHCLEK